MLSDPHTTLGQVVGSTQAKVIAKEYFNYGTNAEDEHKIGTVVKEGVSEIAHELDVFDW